jgi:C-terminal processing protease CtpA/Prc
MENGIAVTSLLDAPGFKVMPIGGRLHVVGWPSDGTPAHPLGLPMASKYPEILRIGGFPVVLSLAPVLLAGPPGSPVELHLRWRDGRVTRHVLRRPPTGTKLSASAFGHLDRRGVAWSQHKTKPFPMLEVATLKSSLSIATLDRALSTHANAKGLILDLRRNLGGSFDLTRKFAGRFLSDSVVLVRVYGKQTTWGGLLTIDPFVRIIWMPRAPRFEPPVVVLTSCLTGSTAEHLARILQRHAGATVIGESTAGAEAGVIHVEGEEGSRLTFSGIRVLDSTGHGLEGQGVIPDRSVPLSLDHVERLGPAAAVDDWRQRLLHTAADVLR